MRTPSPPEARVMADALRRGERQRHHGPQGHAAAAATELLVSELMVAAGLTPARVSVAAMLELLDPLARGLPSGGPAPETAPPAQGSCGRDRKRSRRRVLWDALQGRAEGLSTDEAVELLSCTRDAARSTIAGLRGRGQLVTVDGRHYAADLAPRTAPAVPSASPHQRAVMTILTTDGPLHWGALRERLSAQGCNAERGAVARSLRALGERGLVQQMPTREWRVQERQHG